MAVRMLYRALVNAQKAKNKDWQNKIYFSQIEDTAIMVSENKK